MGARLGINKVEAERISRSFFSEFLEVTIMNVDLCLLFTWIIFIFGPNIVSKLNLNSWINMKVSKWMNKVKATAARNGYVTTLSGRRRLISNIASVNSNERAQAERQGISPLLADIFFTFSPIKFWILILIQILFYSAYIHYTDPLINSHSMMFSDQFNNPRFCKWSDKIGNAWSASSSQSIWRSHHSRDSISNANSWWACVWSW